MITTDTGTACLKPRISSGLSGTVPSYTAVDRRADEAWEALRTRPDWNKWLAIGEALLHARLMIMRETHSNRPTGRRYSESFSAWLDKRKFSNMDGSDRARLFTVMENLGAIKIWLHTLTDTERLRLNHPSSVLRKWHARTRTPDPAKPKKQTLREAHIAVIEENERLKQRIERGDGNLLTRDSTAREIARVMLGGMSEEMWRKVVAEGDKLLADRKTKAQPAVAPS